MDSGLVCGEVNLVSLNWLIKHVKCKEMWLVQISRACGSVGDLVHKIWEAIIHKIFNMRDFPQGHLKVFGYKSDCSCCTAGKDENWWKRCHSWRGRYSLNFCLERSSKMNSLNLGLLYPLGLGSRRHWENWNPEVWYRADSWEMELCVGCRG